MDIVRSVNRSWIYDTQFSLYRAFHPGGKVKDLTPKDQDKDKDLKKVLKDKDKDKD